MNTLKIGPSRAMFFRLLLGSPIAWISLLHLIFLAAPKIRLLMYQLLESYNLGHLLESYYLLLIGNKGLLAFSALLLGSTVACYVAYKTTSFVISGDPEHYFINLNYGLFIRQGPKGGIFTISTDSRMVGMITDVDVSRNLFDMLFKMGSLNFQSANETGHTHDNRVIVPYVSHPYEIKEFIDKNSKIKDSRMNSFV
jgi:hypothetical protein